MRVRVLLLVLLVSLGAQALLPTVAHQPQVRIKDIARIHGVRENQLVGVGLVVGLAGTGDSARSLTAGQMLINSLERFGIDAHGMQSRNVAAVMVTADLPPFARSGDRIDLTVSSIGDARSLQGGVLLLTPLQGADGQVYAVGQGPLLLGGHEATRGYSTAQRNHTTVGRVPGGATVERVLQTQWATDGQITLLLNQPDYTTASRMAQVINGIFPGETAQALDQSAVRLTIPPQYQGSPVEFVAAIEGLPVTPDAVAKVVVNERTGTVVMGHQVRIGTVGIAQGSLHVRVTSTPRVSQPAPLSRGETVGIVESQVEVIEDRGGMILLESESSVADLVNALNAVGATPREIISILEAMKAAGALYGVLEII